MLATNGSQTVRWAIGNGKRTKMTIRPDGSVDVRFSPDSPEGERQIVEKFVTDGGPGALLSSELFDRSHVIKSSIPAGALQIGANNVSSIVFSQKKRPDRRIFFKV